MNFNTTLIGQLMIIWIPLSTLIIGLLARKKSESPIIVTIIGFLLSFIPLFSIIFMAILALKSNVKKDAATV